MEIFIALSIVALLGALVIRFHNPIVSLAVFAFVIALAVGVVYILYGDVVSKGVELDMWDYIWMFLSMLAGMSAKYFYDELEKEAFKFELKKFVRPLTVAPIIFLIILRLINAPELLQLGSLTLLEIYLLSFTNGFFWALGLGRVKAKFQDNQS